MAKTRLAVVGIGLIGLRHAELIAALDAVDLAAVADPSEAGPREAARLMSRMGAPALLILTALPASAHTVSAGRPVPDPAPSSTSVSVTDRRHDVSTPREPVVASRVSDRAEHAMAAALLTAVALLVSLPPPG